MGEALVTVSDAPVAFALLFLTTALAALAQRATGQAFGMIVAPALALAAPEHAPASVLLLGAAITLLSTAAEVRDVAWREVAPAAAGRGVGAFLAASIIAVLPSPDWVAGAIGVAVLAGVGLSLLGVGVAISTGTLLAAGTISGLMGTLTAVGAPPLTLLYQRRAAGRARSTLNAIFLFGVGLSIIALMARGLISAADAGFALMLAPALALGLLAARPVAGRLRGRSVRPFVLATATLAALSIFAKLALG